LRLAVGHEIDATLPETITYSGDPDLAFNVWSILEAVEWRWTINDVLAQPESILNDVMMLAALNAKMKKIERDANG